MSVVNDLRASLEHTRAELDRLRSEKTTIILQIEAAVCEEERLVRQLNAVATVPGGRHEDVPGRWSA
jgi:hypothetical protein